jgi:hypothetical protein
MASRQAKLPADQAEWKSAASIARELNTSRTTIMRMASTGRIKTRVIPTEVCLFDQEEVRRELNRQREVIPNYEVMTK